MVTSFSRGHKIFYENGWKYCDNKQSIDNNRRCKKCGKQPTKEGYDYCLGYIEGATEACCGHGINEGYIKYEKDQYETQN